MHSMPIRPTGRTAQSDCADRGSNPRWAALPLRTAAAPLSYSGRPGSAPGGGSTCSYSNSGREDDLRSRLLRVRLPPSTPGIRSPIHACLVATLSPVRRQSGFDSPVGLAVIHAELAQLERGASFRARRLTVRIRGSALREGKPDRRADCNCLCAKGVYEVRGREATI